MGDAIKVEIMSKEMIKPSFPTSPDLKNFNLSLLDQRFPPLLYTPLLLFYSFDSNNTDTTNISQLLKSSLSKYLTIFYPLAGRIKDDTSIECNDEGVVYVQANANFPMSGLLKQPPCVEVLEQFLPAVDVEETTNYAPPFLFVQANLFQCGGIAIGLRISHRIADAATLCIILKGWAAAAASENSSSVHELLNPDLTTASSVMPPLDSPLPVPSSNKMDLKKKPSRRFVFDELKIDDLKAIAASSSVPKPTRVEAVTAFIWKHVTEASRSNSSGFPKLSVCSHAVNLRKRIIQNSPENATGNLVGHYFVKMESEIEVKSLVCSLRKGLQEFSKTWLEKFSRNDGNTAIIEGLKEIGSLQEARDQIDWYNFSSYCKIPLYDAADFGWGKPTWIAFPNANARLNFAMMIDSREGDGIELWLSLKEEDMALIEHDPEFLAFATSNPSAI